MRGDRARGDRATAAVGPGVRGGRRGSGGRGGGVQAQPPRRPTIVSDLPQIWQAVGGLSQAVGGLVVNGQQTNHQISGLTTQVSTLTTQVSTLTTLVSTLTTQATKFQARTEGRLNEHEDRIQKIENCVPKNLMEILENLEQRDGRSAVLTESMMDPMLASVYEVIAHGFSQQSKQLTASNAANDERLAASIAANYERLAAQGEQQHQHLMAFQVRTEERFIQLEERIDNLEKQAKLDKK